MSDAGSSAPAPAVLSRAAPAPPSRLFPAQRVFPLSDRRSPQPDPLPPKRRRLWEAVPDPAAETELKKLLLQLGFNVVDSADNADYVIRGEALASQAGNYHKFTSASARVELSVFDGRRKLLATGAAKETLAGATYVSAAKDAISQAALILASELFGVLK